MSLRVLGKLNGTQDTSPAPADSDVRVTHDLRPLVPSFRDGKLQYVKATPGSQLSNFQGFGGQVHLMVAI